MSCDNGYYLHETQCILFQKIVANDGMSTDNFGYSLSIHADRLIVGANQDDDNGNNAGAAYIYAREESGSWAQEAKITATDGSAGDHFGISVDVDENRAIIGAPFDGNAYNGSAYIFTRDSNGAWSQEQKITASDSAREDLFGLSVAIDDDRVIIGAYRDDDKGDNAGSAYIYVRGSDGTWDIESHIFANDARDGDQFGYAVDIAGDRALIGANLGKHNGNATGSAYIFTRQSNGSWTESEKITANDAMADDEFGQAVALTSDGARAIIGAYQDDDDGISSGSAYIFTRQSSGSWNEDAKITASDGAPVDQFGYAVAINDDGTQVSIGSPGDYDDNVASGSAYIFTRQTDGAWIEELKITATDADANDQFGWSVAITDSYAISSANYDDDKGTDAGAAYILALP